MKKELVLISLFSLLLLAVLSTAMKSTVKCDYDRKFDTDGDFVMTDDADCSEGYVYDCDDDDQDIFKDCKGSVWSRIIGWLKGAGERQTNMVTGNVVSNIIPDAEEAKSHIERVRSGSKLSRESEADGSDNGYGYDTDCEPVTICTEDFKEVFCPLDFDECCGKYDDCRLVECADEFCEDADVYEDYAYENGEYEDDGYGYEYSDDESDFCTEEYNDCYDGDEAVICKGSFGACSKAFESCSCGTSDDTGEGQLQPDIDSQETVECDTGVYICNRQTITMSGDLADSTVTCKESFSRCAMMYGECKCGNSTKTDFPTQYIGDTGAQGVVDNAQNYWCDYKGRDIPCYMLPENCNKKRNTCLKQTGQWITCEGTFEFCESRYEECLCGVEQMNSGFMVTSAD